MGFFNKVLVQDKKTGNLIDITNLDKEHYESFLEFTTKLKAAYVIALERNGSGNTSKPSNINVPIINNSICGAHVHYQCRFRTKNNKCICEDDCDMKVAG